MPRIEVAWAGVETQWLLELDVPEGTTMEQAVRRSGILEKPGVDAPAALTLGVFGQVRSGDEIVSEGDRVEIYRALVADPKETRRRRAREAPKRERRRR